MKAAILFAPGQVEIGEVQEPAPGDNEVLLKVKACGICGTDMHTYKIGGTATCEAPLILGHEFSGEVVAAGKSVQGLQKGDAVFGTGYRNCGKCAWCLKGEPMRCPSPVLPGEGMDGALAEYVIVPNPMPGQLVFKVPDGMDWQDAALMEPMAVAAYAAKRARIQSDDAVLVLGAGMIGQGIIQMCKAMGAARVIASEISTMRRRIAKDSGADIVLDPVATDPAEAIAEATGGQLASVVFECTGSPAVFKQIPHLVRPFGRVMQVGMFEKDVALEPAFMSLAFQYKNLTIRGCGGQRWDIAFDLYRKGLLKTKLLITQTFKLEQAREAFAVQADAGKSIKVMVEP